MNHIDKIYTLPTTVYKNYPADVQDSFSVYYTLQINII